MELVASPCVLLLDEPTSGLDSQTGLEVCQLLKKIARQQYMTVAAVIHSPSQQAFNQFDDLLLLGKGGRIIYIGPRKDAEAYFYQLGFVKPEDANPADYFMEIATGKAPNDQYGYKPVHLFYCWESYTAGKDPTRILAGTSPRSAMSDKKIDGKRKKTTMKQKIGLVGGGIMDFIQDRISFWKEVLDEVKDTLLNGFKKDPVRETPGFFQTFWLCYKRANMQVFRSPASFIYSQMLNVVIGIFISIAAASNDYYGKLPDVVCATSPAILRYYCSLPLDLVPGSAVYLCMGTFFAGVMAGGATFLNEKVVFWREVASGMSVLPYFLAKVLADIPRIIFAGISFTVSSTIFALFRTPLSELIILNTELFICSFAMGTLYDDY
jgi:energy-coupling factor transporter ATP-binding protein EcfA2